MKITPELRERAEKRRDNHRELKSRQKMALAAYEAGSLLLPYIYPLSPKEKADTYAQRKTQTLNHYENFVRYIIRIYLEGIYREGQVTREVKTEKQGDALHAYLSSEYGRFIQREAAPYCILLDETYIVVDAPKLQTVPIGVTEDGAEIRTRAELQTDEAIARPYLVFQGSVRNVSFTKDGALQWISFEQGDKLWLYTDEETACYRLGSGSRNASGSTTETIQQPAPHGYAVDGKPTIPVVAAIHSWNRAQGEPIGRSMIFEAVYMSIGVLQFISMFIEACYAHLSMKLVMGEETAKATGEIGNYQIIVERPDKTMQGDRAYPNTRYIQMPSVELDKLIEIIHERTPESIMRVARLRSTGGEASGVSKLVDAVPELNALKDIARYLHHVDKSIATLIASKAEYPPDSINIKYPTSFDVRSVTESVTDWTALSEMLASGNVPSSEEFMREIARKVVAAFLPDADAELVDKIHKEIAAWKPDVKAPDAGFSDLLSGDISKGPKDADEKDAKGNDIAENGKAPNPFKPTTPKKTPKAGKPQ
jgi:hypothetical protein